MAITRTTLWCYVQLRALRVVGGDRTHTHIHTLITGGALYCCCTGTMCYVVLCTVCVSSVVSSSKKSVAWRVGGNRVFSPSCRFCVGAGRGWKEWMRMDAADNGEGAIKKRATNHAHTLPYIHTHTTQRTRGPTSTYVCAYMAVCIYKLYMRTDLRSSTQETCPNKNRGGGVTREISIEREATPSRRTTHARRRGVNARICVYTATDVNGYRDLGGRTATTTNHKTNQSVFSEEI